jgi:hypothetical protein
MTKYKIDRDDGMASIQRVKSDLLSDTWWARSSGADVASDVSTFCNLLLHIAGAMSPTGETVSFARDVSSEFSLKVKEQSVKVFQAIDTGGNVMDAIQGGTEELAIQASQQSLRRIGAGQFSAIIDVLKDVQKHAEQAQKATQFKGTVQEQLRKLDDMLAKYSKDMNLQRERLEAIEGIKDTVVAACNSGQPIQNGPQLSSQSTAIQQNLPQTATPATAPQPESKPLFTTPLLPPIPVLKAQPKSIAPSKKPPATGNTCVPSGGTPCTAR